MELKDKYICYKVFFYDILNKNIPFIDIVYFKAQLYNICESVSPFYNLEIQKSNYTRLRLSLVYILYIYIYIYIYI